MKRGWSDAPQKSSCLFVFLKDGLLRAIQDSSVSQRRLSPELLDGWDRKRGLRVMLLGPQGAHIILFSYPDKDFVEDPFKIERNVRDINMRIF